MRISKPVPMAGSCLHGPAAWFRAPRSHLACSVPPGVLTWCVWALTFQMGVCKMQKLPLGV